MNNWSLKKLLFLTVGAILLGSVLIGVIYPPTGIPDVLRCLSVGAGLVCLPFLYLMGPEISKRYHTPRTLPVVRSTATSVLVITQIGRVVERMGDPTLHLDTVPSSLIAFSLLIAVAIYFYATKNT